MEDKVSRTQGQPDLEAAGVEERVVIRNRYGLHGRPTTMFVKLANQYDSTIRVSRDGDSEEVDGKSAIAILSLGMERGSVLVIKAQGTDAAEAMAALTKLVRAKFTEE